MKARLALQPVTRPGAGPVPVTLFLHFHLFSAVLLVFHTCVKLHPNLPLQGGKTQHPLHNRGFSKKQSRELTETGQLLERNGLKFRVTDEEK